MKALLPVALLACVSWALVAAPGYTQEGPAKTPPAGAAAQKPAAEKAAPVRVVRRVPNNYGKLGLSTQQREKIYEVQADYQARIEELEKQLAMLRTERDRDIEAVLTPTQKETLAQLTNASSQRQSAGTPPAGRPDNP